MGVDDEKDQVRRLHRDIRLDRDLIGETVIERSADAAGVDDGAGGGGRGAGGGNAVPRDARLVVDDGDFPPGEAVEKRGFPDVGASDDGDSRHAGS